MRHSKIKVCMMICSLLCIVFVSHASSDTTYYRYTNGIIDMLVVGDAIWCSTTAGVVRWNRNNGSYREFTINEGMPYHYSPGKLGIDKEGLVWVSWEGIRRYDGSSWELIFDDLPDFTAFALGPDGYIWLGVTGKGLVRIKGDEYEVLRMPGTFYPRRIYDIVVDTHGTVWIAANMGVYRLDGDEWTRYKIDESQPQHPVHSLVEINNTILAVGNHGLAVYAEGEWKIIPQTDGFRVGSDPDMVVSTEGSIWFATQQIGIVKYDGSNWTRYKRENGYLPNNSVNNVVFDEDGAVWFSVYKKAATRGLICGLYRFNGDSYDSYSPYHTVGPLDPTVLKVTVGKDTTVYFLGDSGISYFDGAHVAPFYTEADFKDVWYYELDGVVDTNGTTWYGGPQGLRSFDGETWIEYAPDESLKGKRILSFAVDKNNVVWIATDMGAFSYNGENWVHHNADNGFTDEGVRCLITGPDGNIWSGTNEGVWKYENNTWTFLDPKYADFSRGVRAMTFDASGVLWAAYNMSGMLKFNGEQWEEYIGDPIKRPQVYDMAVDHNGDIWYGTYNFGAVRIDGEENGTTSVSDTQVSDDIFDITGTYPNPFNSVTTLSFTLPVSGKASLIIYSITGQEVTRLIDGYMIAGRHSAAFDCAHLSSGVYIYSLTMDGFSKNGKMTLVR